jgi:hypothetical protein
LDGFGMVLSFPIRLLNLLQHFPFQPSLGFLDDRYLTLELQARKVPKLLHPQMQIRIDSHRNQSFWVAIRTWFCGKGSVN